MHVRKKRFLMDRIDERTLNGSAIKPSVYPLNQPIHAAMAMLVTKEMSANNICKSPIVARLAWPVSGGMRKASVLKTCIAN